MPGFKATMEEWETGGLHSGSKSGPLVPHSKGGYKQALAIALNSRPGARKKKKKKPS
jgi:hypothetical protein